MLTGHRHNRPDLDASPTPDDFPGLGALVTELLPRRPGLLTRNGARAWSERSSYPSPAAARPVEAPAEGFAPAGSGWWMWVFAQARATARGQVANETLPGHLHWQSGNG